MRTMRYKQSKVKQRNDKKEDRSGAYTMSERNYKSTMINALLRLNVCLRSANGNHAQLTLSARYNLIMHVGEELRSKKEKLSWENNNHKEILPPFLKLSSFLQKEKLKL